MKNGKLSELMSTPLAIVSVVGVVVLVVEYLFMALLHEHLISLLPFKLSDNAWDVVDAVALTATLSPVLYFLVFRRMQGDVERHRQINAAALNAIIIADGESRITDWNHAAEKMFQYSREEAVGQPLHQLIAPPRYRDDEARGFARFQETGDGPVVGKVTEITALRKDGSEFPVELSISAVRLQGHWHAIGIIHDITERKRAEELVSAQHAEIERARLDWKAVFDSISHPVFLHDGEFRVLRANRAYAEQAGKPFKEIIGQPYYTIFPKSGAPLSCCLRAMEKAEEEEEEEVAVGEAIYRSRTFSVRSEQGVYLYSVHILEDITARRQIEGVLRESEERYRSLFENMLEGYAYCRMLFEQGAPLDFIYLDINDAFKKITGLKEVTGKKITEVIPGIRASNPELFEIYGRVALTGQAEKFETYIDTLGIWFFVTAYSPRKGYFVAVFNDITERKQAEEELRLRAQLLDGTTDSVFVADFDGNFVYLNEAAWKMRGYTRDEMMAMNLHALDVPEYEKLINIRIRELVEKGQNTFESAHRRKDGSVMPIEVSARIIESGGRKLILASVRDITVRKEAEAVLRESGERFHHLFENMSSGVAVYQPDAACEAFTFKSVNSALERIECVKREEVLGRNAENIFPGIRAFGLLEVLKRVCRSGEPEHFPPAFYRDERISGWRENYVYRLDSGEIVAVYDDVTERKQVEQKKLEADALLKDALEDAIGAIAATLEQRDPYTAGHQRRVAQLAAAIGEEMGLTREVLEGIHFGGLIHDLGKISVPAEILGKPGRITDIEFGLIQTHAEAGYQIVKGIAFPWPVADMVRQHHERLDGSGYPQELKGEQIVLEARILAVADVVEAMSANRPYRPGFGMDAALDEITRARGTQLDAVAVDACLRIIREKGFVFTK